MAFASESVSGLLPRPAQLQLQLLTLAGDLVLERELRARGHAEALLGDLYPKGFSALDGVRHAPQGRHESFRAAHRLDVSIAHVEA